MIGLVCLACLQDAPPARCSKLWVTSVESESKQLRCGESLQAEHVDDDVIGYALMDGAFRHNVPVLRGWVILRPPFSTPGWSLLGDERHRHLVRNAQPQPRNLHPKASRPLPNRIEPTMIEAPQKWPNAGNPDQQSHSRSPMAASAPAPRTDAYTNSTPAFSTTPLSAKGESRPEDLPAFTLTH